MKRTRLWRSAAVLALALVALGGCDSSDDPARVLDVDGDGYTNVDLVALGERLGTLPVQPLSDAEEAAILYTREEEKLERDVFRVFDEAYTPEVFTRMAASEQTHLDAVGMLIDKYDLTDPVVDDATGAFADTTLLALYEDLVAQGEESVNAALAAGAASQEMSIVDLDDALAATDNRDVECVFLNLQKGSRNHLRRLVDLLDDRGVEYVPAYLTREAFDAIIASAMEQGTAC